MKASDYIVEYLIKKGITDVFGYPGGMVTHLMDSFSKYKDSINAHLTYNEQGSAIAACGYAQVNGKTGVSYATSGPGATNMITGICNAYMDSIPTLFITGQVNSFEQKGGLKIRQRGFQETDIVSMVSNVTKYATSINSVDHLKYCLDYAFYIANEGRKGPVLLDIAMDVTRAEIQPEQMEGFSPQTNSKVLFSSKEVDIITGLIKKSLRPTLLLGNGVSRDHETKKIWIEKINCLGIPVVSSMIAIDIKSNIKNFYGFIGAYGNRTANFVAAKSDLIVSVGSRLDVRQVGSIRENFAPNAKFIRIDIDPNELEYKVHSEEYSFCLDAENALNIILDAWIQVTPDYSEWIRNCEIMKQRLKDYDNNLGNKFVEAFSKCIPEDSVITTDVGQNQVWIAQSFDVKPRQRILFSGGHGTMGYSLPAAIGAYFASRKKVYSFNGDGGIQMNVQELQVLARDRIPVKIIVFNNNALGMIRHFQEMYFDGNYYQTTPDGGFHSPDFSKLANVYGLTYALVKKTSDITYTKDILTNDKPAFIEIQIPENTYVFPKLEYGKPNQDQEPLLDRTLYNYLMKL